MPGEAEADLKIPRTTIEEENAAAPPVVGTAETDVLMSLFNYILVQHVRQSSCQKIFISSFDLWLKKKFKICTEKI